MKFSMSECSKKYAAILLFDKTDSDKTQNLKNEVAEGYSVQNIFMKWKKIFRSST